MIKWFVLMLIRKIIINDVNKNKNKYFFSLYTKIYVYYSFHYETNNTFSMGIQHSFSDVAIKNFRLRHTLTKHTNNIHCLLLMKDGRIASASDDISFKIYSTFLDYSHIMTIADFSNSVSSLCQLDNEQTVAGSFDNSIRVFEISALTYKCVSIVRNAHSEWITKVIALPNNKVASCSLDKTIKIWQFGDSFKHCPIKVIKSEDNIISMKYINNTIIYGNKECVTFWSTTTQQCVTKFKVSCLGSNSIYYSELLYVSGNNRISIINVNTCTIDTINIEKNDRILCLVKKGNKLICGSHNGFIYIIDINTKTYDTIGKVHSYAINDLLLIDNNTLLSCSADSTIKVWEQIDN